MSTTTTIPLNDATNPNTGNDVDPPSQLNDMTPPSNDNRPGEHSSPSLPEISIPIETEPPREPNPVGENDRSTSRQEPQPEHIEETDQTRDTPIHEESHPKINTSLPSNHPNDHQHRLLYYKSYFVPATWLFIFRVVSLGILIGFLIEEIASGEVFGTRYFTFLTNWSYLITLLYFTFAIQFHIAPHWQPKPRQVFWELIRTLFTLTLVNSIFVAIGYWSVVFIQEQDLRPYAFAAHGGTAILMLMEGTLNTLPVRFFRDMVTIFLFNVVYVLFLLVFWLAADDWVYDAVDSNETAVWWLTYIVGAIGLLVLLVVFKWAVAWLRRRIAERRRVERLRIEYRCYCFFCCGVWRRPESEKGLYAKPWRDEHFSKNKTKHNQNNININNNSLKKIVWCFLDGGKWIPYFKSDSNQIEQHYQHTIQLNSQNPTPLHLHVANKQYLIDVIGMVQQNASTRFKRPIQRFEN
eukprot:gb/GECH01008029.1/.p1 GENE.gb/GECH01008029.1/~~gb/GECH01008029.1/.p1  ORF type:complete len:465 (+),score=82.00 gb/GECH01008029.1/:1-1395(+)